ncbi:hypothetical protein [Neorhizobium alkalisoli]|uniref:Uncharacterized protein n=1 Tax=Neorhizobium alkalisoli TaxID=528178 RepID=A0A561Q0N7_9HYPH|nr:hypothetical protein [Neorhizobium alkalisoli]TWF43909.1 hypothetical protein FHW37_11861 [Neorhizobium alkalisoli]
MTQKTLVEVSVPQADGSTLPYGIMNADQAAKLCDETFQKDVAHEPLAADGPPNQLPVEAI